jgi:hypothetical protein
VLPGSSDQFLFRGGLIAATVVAGAGLVGWRTPGKAA